MNLYLVTCIYKGLIYYGTIDVYVLAEDPNQAQKKALDAMEASQYKFDYRVDEIKLIASVKQNEAKCLLVI